MRYLLLSLACCFIAFAQMPSRSGVYQNSPELNRTSACSGMLIQNLDFEGTVNINTVDGDQGVPHPNTDLTTGGWQVIQDYTQSSNNILVNPTFYNTSTASLDTLFVERFEVPANACMSFEAFSVDPLYQESLLIFASVKGSAILDTLFSDELLSPTRQFYQADLSQFSGDSLDIYIICNSLNKFILAMDNIRITERPDYDLAITEYILIDTSGNYDIYGVIEDFGLLPSTSYFVTGDTNGIAISSQSYSVSSAIDTILLLENVRSDFSGEVCFELQSQAPQDDFSPNNGRCFSINENGVVGNEAELIEAIRVYPNPARDLIHISAPGFQSVQLLDLNGRLIRESNDALINCETCPAGLYLVVIETKTGTQREKIFIR